MEYLIRACNIVMSMALWPLRRLLFCVLLLLPVPALAYRPFVSTDADVAAAGELEIELGYFNWKRAEDENAYVTPQLVFNYGLTDTLEFIAEFDLEHDLDGSSQLVDPGLFLKMVLKQT